MSNTYRIRYKKGDFEVEIESPDKDYVDKKLVELIELVPIQKTSGAKQVASNSSRKKKASNPSAESDSNEESKLDVAALVGFIKDYDKYQVVEDLVLNKKDQLPRIMMTLYFAKDFSDNPHLSTGQIETITDQLGVRIKAANVGTKIKSNQKFFTGQAVRKKGAIVPYKLNRQGVTAFEAYLNGEKLQ